MDQMDLTASHSGSSLLLFNPYLQSGCKGSSGRLLPSALAACESRAHNTMRSIDSSNDTNRMHRCHPSKMATLQSQSSLDRRRRRSEQCQDVWPR